MTSNADWKEVTGDGHNPNLMTPQSYQELKVKASTAEQERGRGASVEQFEVDGSDQKQLLPQRARIRDYHNWLLLDCA